MAMVVHGPVRVSINGSVDVKFAKLSAAVDDAMDSMQRFSDAFERTVRVGDWDTVKKFDRWWNERERKRMASIRSNPNQYQYTYHPITSSNSQQWYTTSGTSTAPTYTVQQYTVPPGTTTVSFPTFNYQTPDWQEFERERRPPPREFNRYVNGSDLLEEFIEYLGTEGVRASEFMGLPVELFVKWLIVRACEEDHEEPPVMVALPAPTPQPRCLGCQRFMARRVTVPLHGPRCAEMHFAREDRRSKIPA